MCWAMPPLPQYAFMVWCSVKAQGQLYRSEWQCPSVRWKFYVRVM